MNFSDLSNYIYDIESRPSRCGVRFGCDCGCGGDFYTLEQWVEGEKAADEAVEKLKSIGIIFNDD